ncbi:helix-turn-helix domain-containing protein [Methylobacterium nonmethylotrophicum]|uniref:Helix-turn-helix domain-containing protein n=1 Tax=Methylobacterium nonmethylotrophicum TaxID=1141884 RepID=A0A4Z0NMP4_9HYPH|nr:helix-turn-helix domain-containing protein [Methylobacterium nonmethylotrophicum]TGD97665.1 helix-turn-helix domain-containing protein [Methylobacterium nonmethylotrophicum]
METVFTTDHVHQRDRFDYWHEVACRDVVDHDSKPDCRRTFEAELRAGSIGSLDLVCFQNSGMTVNHTLHHLSRTSHDEVFLCRQFRQRVALEQNGRQTVLEPGDLTLIDPRLPYRGQFSDGSEVLVVKVQRAPLERRLGPMRDLLAHTLPTPEGRLASAYLAMLPSHVDVAGTAADVVQAHLLDLIALAFGRAATGPTPRPSSARSLVRMRLHTAVEARLADPALRAGTIADAAGVSVRYANVVLADEDTSIAHLIQTRRLARCRQALEDPAQAHRTVSEIAYGWGFSDMTHFGRRFKAAFGLLPRECRRTKTG